MTDRLRVLISAYACSPFKGSEPGVGWGFVFALAQHHDLWVIVEEEKFRADLDRYLTDNPQFGRSVKFFYIKKRRNRWLRKIWPPSYYWYYRRWHKDAFVLAQTLHQDVGFDLVHQLTMVGFREPGYLWRMGLPFAWGPVGGMGSFPWRFLLQLGLRGAIYFLGYNLYNFWQMRWLRRPRLAARIAGSGLIAATRDDVEGARRFWNANAHLLAEVGLPRLPAPAISQRLEGEALRLIWSGLHIPRKALPLALRALARLPATIDWRLDVLGQGPLTQRWRDLATRLGLDERVHFHGWLPREKALDVMTAAHVMLITSLRDLTSTVTVEALALGLPVICPDHCGFVDAVDDSCGVRVAVDHPGPMVAAIAGAVARIAQDELHRQRLAHGALARASRFDWDAKANVVDSIYRRLVARP